MAMLQLGIAMSGNPAKYDVYPKQFISPKFGIDSTNICKSVIENKI